MPIRRKLGGDVPQALPAAAHALRAGNGSPLGFVGYEPTIVACAEPEWRSRAGEEPAPRLLIALHLGDPPPDAVALEFGALS